MRYEEARARLAERQPEHMPGPSLDRIRALTEYLDHPELSYPTVHVTGTNGKSTAARAAAAVACAHGLRTGLFISPHLVDVTERLSVCGDDVSPQAFADTWAYLEPFFDLVDDAGRGPVTYFEALTAMAYVWFADLPVGLGVFEVGMGGSWDATNLVAGDAAVVTPVGMDHVAELGPGLTEIATEKAGIIKPGKVAVVREQDAEVALVLARRADEVGAKLLHERADWEVEETLLAVGGHSFRLRTTRATYEDLYLPVYGPYAVANASAGVVAFEALTDHGLDEEALREGLAAMRAPGRLEVAGREPLLVLDGAHNPDGAAALASALPGTFRWERLHLVAGVSSNKDIAGVMGPLVASADLVYATEASTGRSADAERVAAAARAAGASEVSVHMTVAEAIEAARAAASPEDLILVTGSLFTVGDAKRALAAGYTAPP
jgi:dihydrofolate synthase/folylpolyglutamate synthase